MSDDLLFGMTYGEFVASLRKDLTLDLKTDVALGSGTNELMDSAFRDGAATAQSLRTLGTGASQALPGNFLTSTIGRAHVGAAAPLVANTWLMAAISVGDIGASLFDLVNHWYVVPSTGLYLVMAEATATSAAAGNIFTAGIAKAGVIQSQGSSVVASAAAQSLVAVDADILSFAAGDHIQLAAFSNAALNLSSIGALNNFLSITRIG